MHSTRAQRHGDIHVTHRLNESHRTPAPDYRRAHKWVAKAKGRAALHTCVKCGHEAHEWAYDNADPAELIDKATGLRYSTDPAHYLPMCRKCHGAFDAECRKAWMSLHARRVHNTSMSGPYEDSTTQPRWATKEQAAEHLGVSAKTIIRWADEGRIRRHRFGPRLIRFDLNEIDAMSTPTSTKAAAQ
ncbi:helix-turn-helix transcriptional regulator [Mycolicibacterium fortuitum]